MNKRTFIIVLIVAFLFSMFSACTQQETVNTTVEDINDAVYITVYGDKYHKEDCSNLWNSKLITTREDAINAGFEPCLVCNP